MTKKKTEIAKNDIWSGEGVKIKYDPMLLGPNDKITDGMAEYIRNEAPEYSDLLERYEKQKEQERIKAEAEIDDWAGISEEDDGIDPFDMLSEIPGFNPFEPIPPVNFDFESFSENQMEEAYRAGLEALYELEQAIVLMHGATMCKHFCVKSNDLQRDAYVSWVYNSLFGEDPIVSGDSLKSLFMQFKKKFLDLGPHIDNVMGEEKMVMCKVSNSRALYLHQDEEYYSEFKDYASPEVQFIPLELAKEIAVVCPDCGLWVDKELDRCSCNYIFPLSEEQEREINGDSFVIEMDMEGIDHETVSRVLGGDDFGYCENYQGEEIHFFGGGMGCTTTVNMPESPSGLGADDYAFIVLQDNGYRIYHEQIQDALMEINDNNEEVVNETFYRFFKALYELKGWDYVIDIVQDLIKDDVVYINAALDKTVNWLRENGFVEDYVDEHFEAYVELKHPDNLENNDFVKDEVWEDTKTFTIALAPRDAKTIIFDTVKSIGELVECDKDNIKSFNCDVDKDRAVVSYCFKEFENLIAFSDKGLECFVNSNHLWLIEIIQSETAFWELKVNCDAISEAFAVNAELVQHMFFMFYKGLRKAKDNVFANDLITDICGKSCPAVVAACELVFKEHDAPFLVDLSPTAFDNSEVILTNGGVIENYPCIVDGDIEFNVDDLKLILPEELKEPRKDFLNLMYVVKDEMGQSLIFNLLDGLIMCPVATKKAITMYCKMCAKAFDRNEEYLHKHFAEHLMVQVSLGMFNNHTEFMTKKDVSLFEKFINKLVKNGIEDKEYGQELIESVKNKVK